MVLAHTNTHMHTNARTHTYSHAHAMHTGVTRALCAAFTKDKEPAVCKESWISDDECEVGEPGYSQCRVG